MPNFAPQQFGLVTNFMNEQRRRQEADKVAAQNDKGLAQKDRALNQQDVSLSLQKENQDNSYLIQQGTLQNAAEELALKRQKEEFAMLSKQAIAEGAKYGPEGLAQAYESIGDGKTSMQIRKQMMSMQKIGLDMSKTMQDMELAKKAEVLKSLTARVSALPASQREDEYSKLISGFNERYGAELDKDFNNGNLIALMGASQYHTTAVNKMLSAPETATMAHQWAENTLSSEAQQYIQGEVKEIIRGGSNLGKVWDSKEAAKYDNRAAAPKVTRGTDSTEIKDSPYTKDGQLKEYSPRIQALMDETKASVIEDDRTAAQALSDMIAQASSRKKGVTSADIAMITNMANNLIGPDALSDELDAKDVKETVSYDSKGNRRVSTTTGKGSKKKSSPEELMAELGAKLSSAGISLPAPSKAFSGNDEDDKPLSTVGKIYSDISRAQGQLAALEEVAMEDDSDANIQAVLDKREEISTLKQAGTKAITPGKGINITIGADGREAIPLTKEQINLQEKSIIDQTVIGTTLNKLYDDLETGGEDVLTVKGEAYTGWVQLLDKGGFKLSLEEVTQLEKSSGISQGMTGNLFATMVPLVGTTATDHAMTLIMKTVANSSMGPSEAKIYVKNQLAGLKGLNRLRTGFIKQGITGDELDTKMDATLKSAGYDVSAFATNDDLDSFKTATKGPKVYVSDKPVEEMTDEEFNAFRQNGK